MCDVGAGKAHCFGQEGNDNNNNNSNNTTNNNNKNICIAP